MRYLFLAVFILSCKSNRVSNNLEYYVINIEGAMLYRKAEFDSQVIDTISNTSEVHIIEIVETNQKVEIGKNFEFEGPFMKVNYNEIIGYIHNSDLSAIKPKIIQSQKGLIQLSLFGEVLNKKEIQTTKIIGSEEFLVDEIITEYENAIYTYSSFDGCFDHKYQTRNLKKHEVYHHMVNEYVFYGHSIDGFFIWVPEFQKKDDNKLYFQGEGATEDLIIKIIDEKSFVISSYDCT